MLLVYTCRFTRHSLSYYLDPKPQVQSYSNLYALKVLHICKIISKEFFKLSLLQWK